MIRFRVVKGSHVLLTLAVLALVAVLTAILLSGMPDMQAASAPQASVEAKVQEAFASSSAGIRITVLPDPTPEPKPETGKRILIYHTHTHEAYSQTEEDPYIALEAWRTDDTEHSVVRLGNALTELLEAQGYSVVHDRTDHEQEDINQSYVRSLNTLESYTEEFDLTIDLHRDAYVESLDPCFRTGGTEYAQLMMLVGRGDAYEAEEKPDYDGNLRFAQKLTSAMNAEFPGICRNVTVKKGRYNQHIGKNAILVEVGHNQNTLQQAMNSIPCLARAIDKVLLHSQ